MYCYQVTQVIQWALKNSKKLENMSFPILIYKVIDKLIILQIVNDAKVLLEHSDKKHVRNTLN